MKKLFVVLFIIGICSLGYAQDVKVNINHQDATITDNCPYRINGICATEDIGGVEVEFIGETVREPYPHAMHYMVLTNHNNFPVNVLWQIEWRSYQDDLANGKIKTGNTVLSVDGVKKINVLGSTYWSVKGLIVRKLVQ